MTEREFQYYKLPEELQTDGRKYEKEVVKGLGEAAGKLDGSGSIERKSKGPEYVSTDDTPGNESDA